MANQRRRIINTLEQIGVYGATVVWQPIGKCIEMQGRSGGWMVNDEAIGLNANEAIDFIRRFPDAIRDRHPGRARRPA